MAQMAQDDDHATPNPSAKSLESTLTEEYSVRVLITTFIVNCCRIRLSSSTVRRVGRF